MMAQVAFLRSCRLTQFMLMPNGNLTPTQHQLLETIWNRGARGATVSEIWRQIASERPVQRTTILNLVDRLEKRGWLIRKTGNRASRYVAAMDREETARWLARGFVDDYFAGSSVELLRCLLDDERFRAEARDAMRRLLHRHVAKNGMTKRRT